MPNKHLKAINRSETNYKKSYFIMNNNYKINLEKVLQSIQN